MPRLRTIACFRREYLIWFVIIQVIEFGIMLNFNMVGNISYLEMSSIDDLHSGGVTNTSDVGSKKNSRPTWIPASVEHEKARRKLEMTSNEFWYYINHQLDSVNKNPKFPQDVKVEIEEMLNTSRKYRSTIRSDFDTLRTVDNLENWRFRESLKLGRLVQNRLKYLQNSVDCSKARKLECSTTICGPGFACRINKFALCLIIAYATNRTLIVPQNNLPNSLMPLSETCLTRDAKEAIVPWREGVEDAQNVLLNIDSVRYRTNAWPLAVPEDLADRLERFHGNPVTWWIGQITAYIFRPTKAVFSSFSETMTSDEPIVGLHVRRSDKLAREAQLHSINEYMRHAEAWFNARAIRNPGIKRRVFLATDTPGVIDEIKEKYPLYEVISNSSIVDDAAVRKRGSEPSQYGIIHDIYYLSKCNYLVCTFSSNVCRMAYALMQTRNGDASNSAQSLDDIFYMHGQNPHFVRIIEPISEQMGVGKKAELLGNHWDGFSKVIVPGKILHALVPSYKLMDEVDRAKMPSYPNVDENTFPPFSLWDDLNSLTLSETSVDSLG